MTTPRIRWTSREWGAIASYFLRNNIDTADRGFIRHVVAGMHQGIEKARWRDTPALSNSRKMVEEAMAIERGNATARKMCEEASAIVTPDPFGRLRATPDPDAPGYTPPATRTVSDIVDELAKRIAQVIAAEIKAALVDVTADIAKSISGGPKHDPEPLPYERPIVSRLLVVGPIAKQWGHICDAVPGIDISFVQSEDKASLVTKKAPNCCKIVLWTNFISHAHQNAARNSGKPVVLVSGGIGEVVEAVRKAVVA